LPRSGEPAVDLRIRDQGDGIPVAYRSSIFDQYVRIDDGAASEIRHSQGLGLVFCRRAIEVHGGEIWVEDNLPRGSCFCVRLGRAPRAAAVPPEADGVGAGTEAPSADGLALSPAG
jgi:K+-sensing histidine kinase KdpD